MSRRQSLAHPFDDLIAAVARQQCLTKKGTRGVIDAFIAKLGEAVWQRGRLVVPGLGAFNVRQRKARNVADPRTVGTGRPEPMRLAARRVVTCRVARDWRSR